MGKVLSNHDSTSEDRARELEKSPSFLSLAVEIDIGRHRSKVSFRDCASMGLASLVHAPPILTLATKLGNLQMAHDLLTLSASYSASSGSRERIVLLTEY